MPHHVKLRLLGAILIVALCLTAAFALLEIATGEPAPMPLQLLVDFVELLVLVAAMFASALAVGRVSRNEQRTDELTRRVTEAVRAGEDWRRQSRLLLRGLSEAVEAEFRNWGLTPAEADVAGLMLKGMSMAEIARARESSETTIRQQAQMVYRKSGLSGRAELAAYFLEDMFDNGQRRLSGQIFSSGADHQSPPAR